MKKTALLAALLILAFAIVSCGAPKAETPAATAAGGTTSASAAGVTIKVGASPTPHAEILAQAKPLLAKQGINLEIVEFNDYVLPNTSLRDKSIDANYFQHLPYLENFNKENGTDLVSIGAIHYEPLGLYPGKTKSVADLKDGAQISVPNDATNEARALLLLQTQGIIKLKDGADISATKQDIAENPKNINIVEMEAAQLGRSLQDVDMSVINGNYAMQSGLKVSDAIAKEESDSVAATTYGNIIAVRKGDENRPELKALVTVLKSAEIKKFITDTYKGSVMPLD